MLVLSVFFELDCSSLTTTVSQAIHELWMVERPYVKTLDHLAAV